VRIDPSVYELHYQQKKQNGWPGWFHQEAIDDVLRELDLRLKRLQLGKRVLEVGCGAGDQALLLARRGYDVTGVDISETAVGWAREKALSAGLTASFELGDVRDLANFPDSTFDWVLDGNCWHFVIGEGRESFLRNVHRVLRSGGKFVVSSVCNDPGDVQGVDSERRVQCIDDVAVTYFGRSEELLRELQQFFCVDESEIRPGTPGERMDFLYAVARKCP
jgi:SAM-dependent methyltransferase